MRVAHNEPALVSGFHAARAEADAAFGDDTVYIERFVERPRHVEVQILGDKFGKILHLGERDCSVQRRHQKLIEESPSPALDDRQREMIGAAAVRMAEAANYHNAGTVEFLLAPSGDFYFIEVNARIQVEHTVTELVTGLDLIQEMIRVAAGEPLSMDQSDIQIRGHAIECRIYAEDATENFRPAPGALVGYREPSGPWVRVDSGVLEGVEVPIHYDPMIAKLVVWGETRDEAIHRAARALREYHIVGTATSIPFFLAVFADRAFLDGTYDTGFVTSEWLAAHVVPPEPSDGLLEGLAIAAFERDRRLASTGPTVSDTSAWKRAHRWRTHRRWS